MRQLNLTKNAILSFGSFLLLAVGLGQTAKADYPSTVLSQNPAAFYRLNETIKPNFTHVTNSGSLGTAADGYYTNLPSFNLPGPFTGSSAVGFDGTSQYAYTPWVSGLNTSTFSFEIWANPAVVPKFDYMASSAELNSPRSGWYFAQDDGSTFSFGSAWVVRFFNTNSSTPSVTLHATNATAGVWTHLVITFDGTTAKMYTNGVVADTETPTANSAGVNYVPNIDAPFTIGVRSNIQFEWPGDVAEAAIYPAALSAARVAAHYTAATTAPTTYSSTVLADSPLLYDQFKAPATAVATNSGTLGTSYNGLYLADAAPGAPGPVPPTYSGFPSGNKATAFDAQGGAVRLPAFNFNTNTITISGWINASNSQSVGAGIVVCDSGTTAVGLTIDDVYGGFGLGYFWNNDSSTSQWSPSRDSSLETLPDSQWAFVALVIQPTEADIYIALTNDAATFESVTNYFDHIAEAFDGATLVGTDGGNASLSFNGAIDAVGIWNRSLSSGELYSQYGSAVGGLKPIVFSGPPSPDQPIVAGDTLTLQANAGGTPPLSYLWYSNSVAISWATNAGLVVSNFSIAANSGSYYVVVTNFYGSATSGVASVTGQLPTVPTVVSLPASSATIYPGGVLNLPVTVTGGGLVFQWKLNGTNLLGATASAYFVSSVTSSNAGSYTLAITNALGGLVVGPFVITVPTLVPGTYAAVVDADAPLSWWRLDETSATTGTVLQDAMGRNSGVYTNNGALYAGIPGAIHGASSGTGLLFTGDSSYGYIPYFSALSGSAFSLEMWVKQTNVVGSVTPVSAYDSNGGFGATTDGSYWTGLSGGYVFGKGPGNGTTSEWDPTIYANTWTHIVVIYNVNNGYPGDPWSIYVNGVSDGYIWGSGTMDSSGPLIIGGYGTGTSTVLKDAFIGGVDEVAFYNKALTGTEITAHYNAAFYGVSPTIVSQPQSLGGFLGHSVTFSTTANGAPPLAYQWEENGVALAGQTNVSLTVSNITDASAKNIYSVLVTNLYGSELSSNVAITVYPSPTDINLTNGLVLHLTFDGNYTDSSGRGNNATAVGSPSFVAGNLGADAVEVSTDTTNTTYNYLILANGLGATPSDLQFGSSVDFTISYWVQLPAGAIPGDLPFFGSATNSTYGFGVLLAPAYQTGGLAWSLYDSGGTGAGFQGSANTINDGNWHNVVETFTRTNACITYLDGVAVNSTSIAGIGDVDTGGLFAIGQDPTGAYAQSATFTLDDIGVWRRALTDYEARSIYLVGSTSAKSFNTVPSGAITVGLSPLPTSGKYSLSWSSGTLLEATNVAGPWTAVPGATAPLYQFAPSSTNLFFKVGN